MNYVELLTQEEKSTLCEIISGRTFKRLYKRNKTEFAKIRMGYQIKSLKEEQALSIAIANIDKPFIAGFVNTMVDTLLANIQNNIEKLESEDSTCIIAFEATMLDSVFANNIDLYFKLIGKPLNADASQKFYQRMERIKAERVRNAEVANHIRTMEEENHRLLDQVKAAQYRIDTITEEYEQKTKKIEQEKDKLESLLAEAQEKITQLQNTPIVANSGENDYLAQFDDTDASALPSIDSDEIVSLCGVTSNYYGRKLLIRYADLNYNGYYYAFHKNEEIPSLFNNREKIYCKDLTYSNNFYGIWTWCATPSEKDSSMDSVSTKYNMALDAIEVVTISKVSNLDNLINTLRIGIEYQPHSNRIMFAYYASKKCYIGILCKTKELNTVNGITVFAERCVEVPVYEFSGDDILRLDNGLSFIKRHL